jgi:hypothetical protein
MTTFDERERALEDKFVHDQELQFRITARRDKLFAQLAAAKFGLSHDAESALIATLLAVRDGAGHDERILQEMAKLYSQHSRTLQPAELTAMLHDCEGQARHQIMTEVDNREPDNSRPS